MTNKPENTDEMDEAIKNSAEKNVEALQFNPCLGVEFAVVDLQKRVKALEDKVG